MKYSILLFAILFAFAQSAAAQQKHKLAGHWKGEIHGQVSGKKIQLHIKTHFTYKKNKYSGSVRIQHAKIPLRKISVKKDSVFFRFGRGPGIAKFKGEFQNDSTITGDYYQTGHHLRFELTRYNPPPEHKTPKPYHHKDLLIQKNDSIKIAGTLTWPKNKRRINW